MLTVFMAAKNVAAAEELKYPKTLECHAEIELHLIKDHFVRSTLYKAQLSVFRVLPLVRRFGPDSFTLLELAESMMK